MNDTIQVSTSRNAYARLQQLMVSPYTDANAVIEALLEYEGHPSPAVTTMEADPRHFTLAQEVERASAPVCECGGAAEGTSGYFLAICVAKVRFHPAIS